MKIVIGLGNPGPRYETTRHNVGFLVVDALAEHLGIPLREHRAYRSAFGRRGDIALLKPMTYMNRSGEPLRAVLQDLNPSPERDDVLIVHDDLDQGLGSLRLRRGGGAGGHRGILSIQDCLPDLDAYRLKFGIGKPPAGAAAGTAPAPVVDWVLGPFDDDERRQLGGLIPYAASFAASFLQDGPQTAMNRYNQKTPVIFLLNPVNDRVH